jgi:hypothetical protein
MLPSAHFALVHLLAVGRARPGGDGLNLSVPRRQQVAIARRDDCRGTTRVTAKSRFLGAAYLVPGQIMTTLWWYLSGSRKSGQPLGEVKETAAIPEGIRQTKIAHFRDTTQMSVTQVPDRNLMSRHEPFEETTKWPSAPSTPPTH